MRVPYMVSALLTAALITGCQTSTAADEEAIRDMVRAWDAAVNSRNVDALEAYYSDDAVRMNANEPSIEGWEAIRAAARGWWTGSIIENGETIQDRGNWTASYQRQADGSWRCLWDIWTSALPPRPAPVIEDVDAEAVGSIIADYQQALNSGDLDACMTMYAADAVFMPNEGPPQIGLAAIRTFYQETTLLNRFELTFSPRDVQVSGDLAWATTTIAGRVTPPAGEAYSMESKAVFLFRRSPSGDWRVSRYIFNPNAPLPTDGR